MELLRLVESAQADLMYALNRAAPVFSDMPFGSPIEVMMGLAFYFQGQMAQGEIEFRATFGLTDDECKTRFSPNPGCDGGDGWVYPQVKVGQYVADFFIVFARLDAGHGGLVVECDGHEFHEKTREQAARDKARDRHIAERGYPVVRFTGAEIWRDPFACARAAKRPLEQTQREARDAAHNRSARKAPTSAEAHP